MEQLLIEKADIEFLKNNIKIYSEEKLYNLLLNCNLNTIYEFIIYLYKLNGYTALLYKKGNVQYLLVKDTKSSVKFLLMYIDTKISFEIAKKSLTFLESISDELDVYQYKLISINGYSNNCEILSDYNLVIHDISFFMDILKKYINNEDYIELYSHNYLTSKKIDKDIKQNINNKAAVIQATGTGKSILIYHTIINNFKGKNILYLAPSNYILNQFKNNFNYNDNNIIYMTYSKLMYNNATILNYDFNLIILDEFHRCGAEKWGIAVNKLLNKNCYVLGLTATPKRYLDNNRDMSIELFNNKLNDLPLLEAMTRNIIPIPKYVIALYSLEKEKNIINEKLSKNKILKNKEKDEIKVDLEKIDIDWTLTTGIPQLLKKHLDSQMKKFIVFCEDKKHLILMEQKFKEWFKEAGYNNINTYSLYTGFYDNSDKLELFKNAEEGINLLFTIDMLNEGIHIDIDGVFLLRKTISPIIYHQQIGRAIQCGGSKIPVIFDFVDNFKSIRTCFLHNIEDEIKLYNKKRESLKLKKKEFKINIIDETKDVLEIFNNIDEKLNNDNWNLMYSELSKFKEVNGHCAVPIKKTRLGNWCGKQRDYYKNETLSEYRIKKLNELDFIWNIYEEMWFSRYYEYKNIIKTNKIKSEGLKQWISNQRIAYKENKLSKDKIELLELLNFNWNLKTKTKLDWNEMYKSLDNYINKYKNDYIPTNYIDENGYKLGLWIRNQKNKYKKLKVYSDIDIIRVNKLKDTGIL